MAVGLIVFVPGVLLAELFKATSGPWSVERSIAALTLGFVSTMVGGLTFHALGLGVNAVNWLVWWVVVTGLSGFLLVRRSRRRGPPSVLAASGSSWRLTRLQGLCFILALVVAGGAIRVARMGLDAQPVATFTQLWMTPSPQTGFADIGIANAESGPTVYRVEVALDGDVIARFGNIALDAGARWSTTFPVPDLATGPVEARLYRSIDDSAYRRVSLWPTS